MQGFASFGGAGAFDGDADESSVASALPPLEHADGTLDARKIQQQVVALDGNLQPGPQRATMQSGVPT